MLRFSSLMSTKPSPIRLTYMIVNVMVQNYLFGSVRWPWVSELYEYCQGVFLANAIASVVMKSAQADL